MSDNPMKLYRKRPRQVLATQYLGAAIVCAECSVVALNRQKSDMVVEISGESYSLPPNSALIDFDGKRLVVKHGQFFGTDEKGEPQVWEACVFQLLYEGVESANSEGAPAEYLDSTAKSRSTFSERWAEVTSVASRGTSVAVRKIAAPRVKG